MHGTVAVAAPGKCHIELEDGRLVSAPNNEVNLVDVCRRRDSALTDLPVLLGEDEWPPPERRPCEQCGRLCTDQEFGHFWKKGRKACCHCRVDGRGKSEKSREGRKNLKHGIDHQGAAGKARAQQARKIGGRNNADWNDMGARGRQGWAVRYEAAAALQLMGLTSPRCSAAGGLHSQRQQPAQKGSHLYTASAAKGKREHAFFASTCPVTYFETL